MEGLNKHQGNIILRHDRAKFIKGLDQSQGNLTLRLHRAYIDGYFYLFMWVRILFPSKMTRFFYYYIFYILSQVKTKVRISHYQ